MVLVLTQALDRTLSTQAERALERLGRRLDAMEDHALAAQVQLEVEQYEATCVSAARWPLNAELRRLRYVLRRLREEDTHGIP